MYRSERAFTLVEVLVSLALVLGGLVGVLGLIDHLSASSKASLRRAQAHHLLMATMERALPGVQGGQRLSDTAMAEASRLVAAVMPGASLHYAPVCPRWSGEGCLVIGWGPGGGAPCIDGNADSSEAPCLAVAL